MLSWLSGLSQAFPSAYAIMVIALVIAGGLVLGGVRIRGIGIGSAGVLFAGILVGWLAHPLAAGVLDFIKEFGLVLFVFTIGLQLGPGFAASLRAEGLRLNLLATAVVLLGSLLTMLALWTMPGDPAGILGVLSGAVTNTPALGATQQALKGLAHLAPGSAALPAIAYAVCYPGGIAGIISSLLLLRWWLRIDPEREAQSFAQDMAKHHQPFARRTFRVDNPLLAGLAVARIPGQQESGVTISRIRHGAEAAVRPIGRTTTAQLGDRLLVVGPPAALDHFQPIVGAAVDEDLIDAPGLAAFTRMVVTAPEATGQHLGSLRLGERFGVTVTRVQRAGFDMSPASGLRLHFGDVLYVVGERLANDQAARVVGDQPLELNQTHFASIFTGIALGVLVGMVPLALPGLSEPVRLGFAGGPLIIAIILGRLGSFGRMIWHMPDVANRSFRELGIALFLAAVGLNAGPDFLATVSTPIGWQWAVMGLAITMVPLLLVGAFARAALRMNFVHIGGLLAGSMTDPPALAFTTSFLRGEGPSTAYATVYPLTMLLRIVMAQVLVVGFCR